MLLHTRTLQGLLQIQRFCNDFCGTWLSSGLSVLNQRHQYQDHILIVQWIRSESAVTLADHGIGLQSRWCDLARYSLVRDHWTGSTISYGLFLKNESGKDTLVYMLESQPSKNLCNPCGSREVIQIYDCQSEERVLIERDGSFKFGGRKHHWKSRSLRGRTE